MADPFITRTIERIREELDEPATNAKYSDSRLIEYIEMAYADVFQELNRISRNPIVPYVDIDITTSKYVYDLPPVIHKIIDMHEVTEGTTDDSILIAHTPTTTQNAAWPGLTLQGHTLTYLPGHKPHYNFTLRVYFMPSGCARLHHTESVAGDQIENDTTNNEAVITLPATTTAGVLDNRPNAYVGSVLRTIGASVNDYQFDRIITAYDVTTRKVTVKPAFPTDQVPGDEDAGETFDYEIAPPLSEALDWQIGLAVAEHIASFERDAERIGLINRQFQKRARTTRLNAEHYNTITARSMTNTGYRNFNTIPNRLQNRMPSAR